MDLDDFVAQQEIRDVLCRYTRGIDRMDPELVKLDGDRHGPAYLPR